MKKKYNVNLILSCLLILSGSMLVVDGIRDIKLEKARALEMHQEQLKKDRVKILRIWKEEPYEAKLYYLVVDGDTVVGVEQLLN